MRFEYLILKTRGERKAITGTLVRGKEGPLQPPNLTMGPVKSVRAGVGWDGGFNPHRDLLPSAGPNRVPEAPREGGKRCPDHKVASPSNAAPTAPEQTDRKTLALGPAHIPSRPILAPVTQSYP